MLVVDFEVYAKDWCMCGLDLVNQKKIEIVNDPRALKDFYEANKHNIFIGYNIRNYDQYIFKSILCGFNPKQVNDWIIKEKQAGYKFSSMFNRITLPIFDIMPSNQLVGLKQLEGFMGVDIRETTVPFDIDRKLTKVEMDEVLYYCNHDVECTAMVLNKRIEEYTSQLELVKMFDMPRTAMGKTKAQLSAEILGAVRTPNRGDELNYNIPDNLKIVKYQYVVDWFRNAVNDTDKMLKEVGLDLDPTNSEFLKTFYGRSLKTVVAGTPHIFAWGGLHGGVEKYHKKGRFINVDVALNN